MNKTMRMCTTYLALTALLLVVSASGWGSMMPVHLSVKPTVTINHVGQADPTSTEPIRFTVVFSKVVKDFAAGDITITGTAPGASVRNVTGSGKKYYVYVTGMTASGTVTASLEAGVAHDAVGNASTASNFDTVTYNILTVTINKADGQADPTNTLPIHFTVIFSEAVTDFTAGDVTITGTAPDAIVRKGFRAFFPRSKKPAPGKLVRVVSGTGTTYDVEVSGMSGNGTVIANLLAGVAHNAAGLANRASNSATVTYDLTSPTVTIKQKVGQLDPTNAEPILFTVIFSEDVTGFATGDVKLTDSTAPGILAGTVTGSGATYEVAVTGMTNSGDVIASLLAGVAHDAVDNASTASTSTDDTVTYDPTPLNVTINQATNQADPTNTGPIYFTVVFSKVVTDFTAGDVTISGTAPDAIVTNGLRGSVPRSRTPAARKSKTPAPRIVVRSVTGSGTTYLVAVTGMTGYGTVIADLLAGVAHDAAGNASTKSTSTDHTVTYDPSMFAVTINKAPGQDDPANTMPIHFAVVFSKVVNDFAAGDVTLTTGSGMAPGASVSAVNGSGMIYDVEVTGMTGDGDVIANLAAGVAHDADGNASMDATFTDNNVTYDATPPIVTSVNRNSPIGQNTNADSVTWRVTFFEPVNAATASPADFTLVDVLDSISGESITAISPTSGSSTTIDVTANTGTGTGTLRLDVLSPATINDPAGNDYNSDYTSGQTYIIRPPYTLTVIADHGTVTKSPDLATYIPGSVVTLTAVPAANYHFTGWSGGLSGTTSPATITMDEDKTVTAIFALGPAPIDLGEAEHFGIFGGSAGMTNQGTLTIINGDIGTIATGTSSITGFHDTEEDIFTETGSNVGAVNGTIYTCTNSTTGPTSTGVNSVYCALATQARLDAVDAYNALALMPSTGVLAGNLAGTTITPGVYTNSTSVMIQGGNLTLDAGGDANAVFVFQIGSTFTVGGPGAAFPQSIILAGNAQAKNIFWQVGSAATINAAGGGTMEGTIISQEGTSFSTAGNVDIARLNGRVLSLGASVTLVNTVINTPAP